MGIAAISLSAGCGTSTPTKPGTIPSGDARPSALTVIGDTTLRAVGDIGHFTAIATWPDESTKDVTSGAVWFSQQPAVVSVVSPGILKAVSLGRTTVSVGYPPVAKDLVVEVRPPGTFVLVGTISEPTNLPVDGAGVEIVSGPSAVRSTQSRSDGRYEFFGLSGNLQIRVTKEGYNASEQVVSVTADQVLDFQIRPLVDPADVAGVYRLTMTASAICSSNSYYGKSPLSPEARSRTYDATLTQEGALVRVELSGADFVPFPPDPQTHSGRAFFGHVSGQTITFNIVGDPEFAYDLLERLTPISYLGVGGKLVAAIRSSTIDGYLDGLFTEFIAPASVYISATIKGNCEANAHHFVFERTSASPSRTRLRPPLP